MRADRVVVEFGSQGEFERIVATGQVYYVTPKQTIRADRADYEVSSGQITATGDVILTEGQSVVTGGRIIYNVNTESARVDGGSSNQGRVRGVFYPSDRSE